MENSDFSNLGEFLKFVRLACDGKGVDDKLEKATGMSEGTDSAGGYLVPPEYYQGITTATLEDAIVRPRALVMPMLKHSKKVPLLYDVDRSSTLFGGVDFSWLDEGGDKTTGISKPSLGAIELQAHKAVVSCWASYELESDAVAYSDFVKLALGQALRFFEDEAFIWGTGVGQPLGILKSGALIKVNRVTINDISWSDITGMACRMHPAGWRRSVWLANPDILEYLLDMIIASPSTVNVWGMESGMENTGYLKLLGRPVIITEKAETLGSLGDLIFADFSHYVIGDRSWTVAISQHEPTGFISDEIFIKVVLRCDGQPLISAPYTPRRSTTKVSPFIALDEPAA